MIWDTWDTWDACIYICCTTGEANCNFSGGLFRSGTLGTAGTQFREVIFSWIVSYRKGQQPEALRSSNTISVFNLYTAMYVARQGSALIPQLQYTIFSNKQAQLCNNDAPCPHVCASNMRYLLPIKHLSRSTSTELHGETQAESKVVLC